MRLRASAGRFGTPRTQSYSRDVVKPLKASRMCADRSVIPSLVAGISQMRA